MAKFFGTVGYAVPTEIEPGVWEDVVYEYPYFGDVVQNIRDLKYADNVNPELSLQNSVSIVGDDYAYENYFAIRYIRWGGGVWTVSDVTVQRPRLILRMGGVYHGPSGAAADSTWDSTWRG